MAQKHRLHSNPQFGNRILNWAVCATVDDIAVAENIDATYVCRILRLTLLAPDIVEAALDGRHPPGLALARVMRAFALEWEAQRKTLR